MPGKRIQDVCARCRPRLVINMGDHPDDLQMLDSLDRTIRQILSIEVDYFGFIVSDPAVRDSIRHGKSLLTVHPDSPAARSIAHIARRITRFWHAPIPNSAELLIGARSKGVRRESSRSPAGICRVRCGERSSVQRKTLTLKGQLRSMHPRGGAVR